MTWRIRRRRSRKSTAPADDGTWFIKDIRSKPKFEDNLRNPVLAMMYGFLAVLLQASARSEPGGAGLGTLGFNPEVAESMSRKAGFTQFSRTISAIREICTTKYGMNLLRSPDA